MKLRQRDFSIVKRPKKSAFFQATPLLKRSLSDGAISCSTTQKRLRKKGSLSGEQLVERNSLSERSLQESPAKLALNEFSRNSSEHAFQACSRCPKFLKDYERMEEMYKAKIARLNEELKFLQFRSIRFVDRELMPGLFSDNGMEGMKVDQESPEGWLLVSQIMRKNEDLTTLVTQLKHRVQCLAQSEAELMRKLSESIETAELAKVEKTKAEMTCQQLYLELDASRVRFEEALQEHADDQQRKLVEMLNHADTRLESVRATLMLSEGKTAEALARAEQATTEAEELRHRLEEAQRETKRLQELQLASSEEAQATIAGLKIKADTVHHDLVDYKEKTEVQMQLEEEKKKTLKLRISELHDRAEKAETEVVTISETNIRLLSRVTSLEKQIRELEADHQYAAQKHEEEMKELFRVARARELELTENIEELTRLKDDKLSQASSLLTQYRSMLLRVREESRTGIDLFDSTLEAYGRKHWCLTNMATAAQKMTDTTEREMQRLREETVDHLHQADLLSKEVWRLEEAVAAKEYQITSLRRDVSILVDEIMFLREQLTRYLPEEDRFTRTKFSPTDPAPTNFLANLESTLLTSAVPEDMRADIRSCATGLLRQEKHHQVLVIDEEKGLQSLKTDDSIVIVSADKVDATVIMEKSDYVNKANQFFNVREAYAPLAEDPTKKQAAAVKKKVNELTRLNLITPDDSICMTLNDPRIAHAYGPPKVPKEAIKFTREEATGGILPFLDVSIQTLSDGGLATSVYRKDSSADVILNYESDHPAAHKRSCVRTLFHRACRYCSGADLLKKELAFLCRSFRLNGYPVSFVKNCPRHRRQPRGAGSNEGPELWKFFSLPSMQGISEAIARQLNQFGIFIAHKPASSLRATLSRVKDPIPKEQQTNVIYAFCVLTALAAMMVIQADDSGRVQTNIN
ncbi:hypothetical protein SprV_0401562500 [Sparganum proliferum]